MKIRVLVLSSSILVLGSLVLVLGGKMAFAQNIETGNASATSTVETNIQGSGTVHTHIETSANGQTKVLDTTGPGVYKVEVNSNNSYGTSSAKVISSPTLMPAPSPKSTPKENISKPNGVIDTVLNIKTYIADFFKKIIHAFSLERTS